MDGPTLRRDVAARLDRGEIDAARELSLDFIRARPDDVIGYQNLGHVFEAMGDKENALSCYHACLPAEFEQENFQLPDVVDASGSGRGVDWLEAHPAERTAARSAAAEHPPLSGHAKGGLVAFATGTAVVEDGSLCHDIINSVVLNRDGCIVREAQARNAGPVLNGYTGSAATRYAGDVVLLGAPGSMNYFHWMTDVLPKLAVLERSGLDWQKATFVIPRLKTPFQFETLAMLGIDPSRIHETRMQGEYVAGDRLLIPRLENTMCMSMGSWLSPFLRERFGGAAPQRRDRRLFVSRDPDVSHGRGLGNLAEINDLYASMGYEVVIPDRYGIREQFELFASASHVAGPHGAGFANLHFCNPGTEVFELFGDHLAPCYWAMCELNGLHYHNCRGERSDPSADDSLTARRNVDTRRAASFSVPTARIEAMHAAAATQATTDSYLSASDERVA